MPRTEMGEQIVLLVEVKRTDKAFERPPVTSGNETFNSILDYYSPLFMECLHVCQQQSSL